MSVMASQITGVSIVYSIVYSFVQARIKSNIEAPRYWPFSEGISPVIGESLAQRASNAENVSIWWRHHDLVTLGLSGGFFLMALIHYLNKFWRKL